MKRKKVFEKKILANGKIFTCFKNYLAYFSAYLLYARSFLPLRVTLGLSLPLSLIKTRHDAPRKRQWATVFLPRDDCVFEMGHPRLFFLKFRLPFQVLAKIAGGWIRTWVLCYRKQLLCQQFLTHCQRELLLFRWNRCSVEETAANYIYLGSLNAV